MIKEYTESIYMDENQIQKKHVMTHQLARNICHWNNRMWKDGLPPKIKQNFLWPSTHISTEAWLRGATPRPRSEWWPRGATPRPRSSHCEGAGGPRGTTPRSRSGGATSSKVRSSGCALLEQREEIPHVQGKRNPSKVVVVARRYQKADRLKP